jgi:CRISPR-associated protein Cas2
MYVVIAYDTPDDKRRGKIAKILKNFGFRTQLSVFEAILSNEELERLITKLKNIADNKQDSIRIYSLCAKCQENMILIGISKKVETPAYIIL